VCKFLWYQYGTQRVGGTGNENGQASWYRNFHVKSQTKERHGTGTCKEKIFLTFYLNLDMAFDGFGGAGGSFAQQLEIARSPGTSYHAPDTSASLNVSFCFLCILIVLGGLEQTKKEKIKSSGS